MTDGQLTAIISAFVAMVGAIAGAIRWVGGRLTAALDRNTAAHIESAKVLTAVVVKVDELADIVRERTPVEVPRPHGMYHLRSKDRP